MLILIHVDDDNSCLCWFWIRPRLTLQDDLLIRLDCYCSCTAVFKWYREPADLELDRVMVSVIILRQPMHASISENSQRPAFENTGRLEWLRGTKTQTSITVSCGTWLSWQGSTKAFFCFALYERSKQNVIDCWIISNPCVELIFMIDICI